MNIPPILFREPEFLTLRESIGLGALHALVALGTTMQSRKSTTIKLTGPRQLAMTCDLLGDVDPQVLWEAMVGTWLMPAGDGEYEFPLFSENNRQMLTNWENGRRLQAKSTQAKSSQVNSMQPNSTQSNSTQLNSDAGVDAHGIGGGTARKFKYTNL